MAETVAFLKTTAPNPPRTAAEPLTAPESNKDSLTAGFFAGGAKFDPYGRSMAEAGLVGGPGRSGTARLWGLWGFGDLLGIQRWPGKGAVVLGMDFGSEDHPLLGLGRTARTGFGW